MPSSRATLALSSLLSLSALACGDSSAEPSPDASVIGGSDASVPGDPDGAEDADGHAGHDAGSDADGGTPSAANNADVGKPCDSEACPAGLECESSEACAFGATCPMVCVRPTADCVGDPCGDEAYCRPTWGSAGGTCYPKSKQGEICSPPPLGRPEVLVCVDGTFCDDQEPDSVCAPQLGPGDACPETVWAEVNPCADGYACEGPFGATTCQPSS